jgi:hypothetical protein
MKVIMDSDSLIKLTKAEAKEIVLESIEAHIPPKVFEVVVTIPKEEGYPDAFLIEESLQRGLLAIGKSGEDQHIEEMITGMRMGYGEADVFRLYKSGSFDAISSDDSRFLKIIDALSVPYLTPSALIVYLFDKKILSGTDAKMYINNLKEMVSEEEYYLAIREVE